MPVSCDDHPEKCTIDLRYPIHGIHGSLKTKNKLFNLSDIDAVWWRFKPIILHKGVKTRKDLWSEFVLREWKSVLEPLGSLMSTQLMIARELGFMISRTFTGNDSLQIENFLTENKKESVYKALTWYSEGPDRMLFTSKITNDQVRDGIDFISVAPGIYQERIDKAYEVRVTTVGKKLFSAVIESQLIEETRLDWRRNQLEIPCAVYAFETKLNSAKYSRGRKTLMRIKIDTTPAA